MTQLVAVVSGHDGNEIEFVGLRDEAMNFANQYGQRGWEFRYATSEGYGQYILKTFCSFALPSKASKKFRAMATAIAHKYD